MTDLISRMLFHNNQAMRCYVTGKFPPVQDVIRDIYVEEWQVENQFPDHYLKNRRDFVLRLPADSVRMGVKPRLSRMLLDILDDIGDRYLIWNGNRLAIVEELFGEWQQLLPRVSPLLIMSRKIQREAGPCPTSLHTRSEYVRRWLEPNFRFSSLPYPWNPLLEGMIRREGLIEIHCHLSGSTEADTIWLDAVARPDEFYREIDTIRGEWQKAVVAEQYQQIEPGITARDIRLRLHAARRLRHIMCDYLFGDQALSEDTLQNIMAVDIYGLGSETYRSISGREGLRPGGTEVHLTGSLGNQRG
jgi:hypothetical protein